MSKKAYYLIAGGFLFLGVILLIKKNIQKKEIPTDNEKDTESEKDKILFLGGLDDKKGYKVLSEQERLIKKGLNKNVDIDSYRYTNPTGIINAIKKYPNSYIILFSAGAKHSSSIAEEILKNKGDLKKMFILEPYNDFKTTYNSVNKAIKLGVPQKNVWVGTTQGTGLGIINNPTKTPYCLPKHWCSLTEFGKII
jgi:hypothetical protein